MVDVTHVRAATYEADIEKSFGALPPQLLAAYPHRTDAEAKQARLDFERDLRFTWDMWTWARLQTAHGRAYVYLFNQTPPFPKNSVRHDWRASHFAELWYMFGHLDQERWDWTAGDRKVSALMTSYWSNFVKTGDPDGPGLPQWPTFDTGSVMHFFNGGRADTLPGTDRLRVFDAVYDALRAQPLKSAP